jgi:uncharacterized protein YbaP (TraB family)
VSLGARKKSDRARSRSFLCGATYDRVFTKRNTSWVEQFIELSKENPGSYFVLVGSGHYFGPNNLLELLESKGYTIEKI